MSPARQDENTSPAEPQGTEETAATEAAEAAAKAAEAASEASDAAQAASKAAAAAAAAAKADDAQAEEARAEHTQADEVSAGDGQADEASADDAQAEETAQEPEAKPARRRAAAKPAAKAAEAKTGDRAKAPARTRAKKAPSSTEVEVDLPAEIFDTKVNVPLIHQVVVAQQAAGRQGTHAAKNRGDVRGGGKKPYRQKGTGRARQGSIRAPQFAGGGTVHGPVSRSHAVKTPKKMKAAALRGALSDRARHGLVQVVSGLVDGDRPKTGDAVAVLSAVTGAVAGSGSVLVVVDRADQVTWKSLRNARGVHLIDPGQLNTYDVLVADRVVFTSAAYESFVARTGGGNGSEER